MTYEEIVERVREKFENADARLVFEHCAIQINITGEGEGAFYIEIANREITVEPYEYYDKDALMVTTGEVLYQLLDGKLSSWDAYTTGLVHVYGDMGKVMLFNNVVF